MKSESQIQSPQLKSEVQSCACGTELFLIRGGLESVISTGPLQLIHSCRRLSISSAPHPHPHSHCQMVLGMPYPYQMAPVPIPPPPDQGSDRAMANPIFSFGPLPASRVYMITFLSLFLHYIHWEEEDLRPFFKLMD